MAHKVAWLQGDQNETDSCVHIEIQFTLNIGSNSSNPIIDPFDFKAPNPFVGLAGKCTTEGSSNSKKEANDKDQSLDLELTIVREEESVAFQLLRATLSPLILIADALRHGFEQHRKSQPLHQQTPKTSKKDTAKDAKGTDSSHDINPEGHYEPIELIEKQSDFYTGTGSVHLDYGNGFTQFDQHYLGAHENNYT